MYTFCVLLPTFLTPISAILSGTGPKPGSKVLFPGALPLASAGVGGYIEVPNVSSDILEKHNFSIDSVAGGC